MAELSLVQNDSSDLGSELRALFSLTKDQNVNQLPPEIFDLLFRLLDQNSLRQTRLVSRKWNDFALSILSKTPGRVELFFEHETGVKADGLKLINKLESILPLTQYPEMFFTKLILFGRAHYVGDVGNIQLHKLLQKFGSNLKSLKLKYINVNLSILRQILENWCVNLEELHLNEIVVTEDSNTTVHDFETSPTTLNLKLRKLNVHRIQAHLIVSIVKSCPKLQVLLVDIFRGSYFWREIQTLPEITKNLEEVKIVQLGRHMTELGVLNDVSFSNKLTSLTLDINIATFYKEELVRLLKNMGESLEKLSLHLSGDKWDVPSYRKIELPWMKRLKMLALSSFVEWFFIDCLLERLPSLEIFRLSHRFRIDSMDALFLDASYYPICPHKILNNLSIKQFIQSPETIFVINRVFPNLRDINLMILTSAIPQSTEESWFIKSFKGLAEMKKLKILDLTFYDTRNMWDGINFDVCFSPLVATESLQELKLTIHRGYTSHYPQHFHPSLEKVVVKIPNLKVLTLKNFRLEKSESMRLLKTLGQKGILLKANENVLNSLCLYHYLIPN